MKRGVRWCGMEMLLPATKIWENFRQLWFILVGEEAPCVLLCEVVLSVRRASHTLHKNSTSSWRPALNWAQ
jgi:hypothetical protein